MLRTKVNLGSSVEEILEKINEEDIYILEISSDGGSLTETQFTQFKENFPYVSILLWYAGCQYLITNIQEYSYTYEGGVSKSYVGDITVNDAELRVTINEDGIWTAQPFIPASKQISDISVGKRTLQKISLGRKNDEGVSIVTEEIDEAGSISYEVNEDNTQSLTLTSEHAIDLKANNQSGISIVDRDVRIYVPEEDASIISITGGDVSIEGAFGGVGIKGANSELINLAQGNIVLSSQKNININSNGSGSTKFKGNVDFANANVTGLDISADAKAIVDVATLPTENVNENVIYRVPSAMFYHIVQGKLPTDQFLCNVVDTLPEVGNPAVVFDASYNPTFIEGYYVASENKAYGYVDNMLSQIGASLGQTIPVGWYPLEVLFPIINQSYGGIINSLDQATDLQSIYLLVEYGLFIYKNGRYSQPSVDTNADFKWNGTNTFNNSVLFNKEAYFNGTVNFSNATVTGLPSGGSIDTTADITWDGDHKFNGNVQFFGDCAMDYINCDTQANFNGDASFYGVVDFTNATEVIGLPSGGSLDLDADYNWNGNHTFNNGLTVDGILRLANNGHIDITDDYVEIRHPQLTLSGDDVHLYANQSENSAIEILAGTNDDTSFYISPGGLDVTANQGNISFTTGNQGSISFTANGEESYTSINLYDTSIEYSSQNHSFFGEVDFSDATVIGLPSGLDIPSEVISYDSENNSLSFNTKTLNFNASDNIRIGNNLNCFYFGDTEQNSQFNLDLADQTVMFQIFYDKENETSQFYCDANIVDFANSSEVKVGSDLFIGSRGTRLSETGDYLGITDPYNIYLCVESGGNSSIDIYGDNIEYYSLQHNFSGNVKFSGEIDFSNATVTGLPSSGGGKTKITLAELRTMLTNHTSNSGKLIQFVYKGSTSAPMVNGCITHIGILAINSSQNSLSKFVTKIEPVESGLSGTNYTFYLDSSSAYFKYDNWSYTIGDASVDTSVGADTFTITDSTFDIYVIGG